MSDRAREVAFFRTLLKMNFEDTDETRATKGELTKETQLVVPRRRHDDNV